MSEFVDGDQASNIIKWFISEDDPAPQTSLCHFCSDLKVKSKPWCAQERHSHFLSHLETVIGAASLCTITFSSGPHDCERGLWSSHWTADYLISHPPGTSGCRKPPCDHGLGLKLPSSQRTSNLWPDCHTSYTIIPSVQPIRNQQQTEACRSIQPETHSGDWCPRSGQSAFVLWLNKTSWCAVNDKCDHHHIQYQLNTSVMSCSSLGVCLPLIKWRVCELQLVGLGRHVTSAVCCCHSTVAASKRTVYRCTDESRMCTHTTTQAHNGM